MNLPTKPFFKLLLLIILPLNAGLAWACINSYSEEISALIDGSSFVKENALKSKVKLEEKYKNTPSIEVANDLAVVNMLLNDNQKAIALLKGIEKERPGLAKTATNLGTAYELLGNNEDALVWIKEGIKRDPNDHQGTEWVHVKILEAKLAIAKDPSWLKNNSVLGLDFGKSELPSKSTNLPIDHLGKIYTLEETRKAIDIQLHERMKFVKAPNALIGDLFFTWADINRILGLQAGIPIRQDDQNPKSIYEAAIHFGVENTDIVKKRLLSNDFLIEEIVSYLPDVYFALWILFWPACIVLIFLGLRKFNRLRKK